MRGCSLSIINESCFIRENLLLFNTHASISRAPFYKESYDKSKSYLYSLNTELRLRFVVRFFRKRGPEFSLSKHGYTPKLKVLVKKKVLFTLIVHILPLI